MKITGSLIQAYNICPRQAWLMSRQMSSNRDNSFLEIGRLIDQTTFEREKKKIYLAEFAVEIDFITLKNGSLFVAEIKKSSRAMASAIKQLKYYIYLLSKKGIKCKGVIKIPKEKISITVEIEKNDEELIKGEIDEIEAFLSLKEERAPIPKKIPFCKKCSYFEFCWS